MWKDRERKRVKEKEREKKERRSKNVKNVYGVDAFDYNSEVFFLDSTTIIETVQQALRYTKSQQKLC